MISVVGWGNDASKASIGSCAFLGENTGASWDTCAWHFGALQVVSQCPW